MKILMINKFLHPNGGSETYIFKLGEELMRQGHEVQYFGMEHENRCVGNRVNAYTTNMDFHEGKKLTQLTYSVKTIYSSEARRKIRLVLEDFQPDVCHLNNFNYQLTPSIILEIRKWERQSGHQVKIVATAHDYQLVCPNHMLRNPNTHENCEKCLGGHYVNCAKGRCIHGSLAKSIVGTLEAIIWNKLGCYQQIDQIICCSEFLKTKLDTNPVLAKKTVAMHNFIDAVQWKDVKKKDYVLYFGRFSEEKGIHTLMSVCRELSEVPFVFAGTGPMAEELKGIPNVTYVGFQTGDALEKLIREARFSVYPSEWNENCPFSVMESQMYGTPVLGSDMGGIPELVQANKTGELFTGGDAEALKTAILRLWDQRDTTLAQYAQQCKQITFDTTKTYTDKLLRIYNPMNLRVLMINKFLHPNGGSETYIFQLGQELTRQGHQVQYFGMDHEKRCVGNGVNAYTTNMDFHEGKKLTQLSYSVKTIYSREARKKIRLVLDDFRPDVCHLNNFNYQLTPSIILEIRKWERESGHKVKIVATAHDFQLVCPNHMLRNPNTHENCEKCLGGHYGNCIKGRCIHGSLAKSMVGTLEAVIWNKLGCYRQIDQIICCSNFLKTKLDTNPILAGKTVAMHNFIDSVAPKKVEKKDYVLYFGRFSEEKGVRVLADACKALPDIPFVCAGAGPLEEKLQSLPNAKCVGFQTGEALDTLIREAKFSLCVSVVHENCPFSVMESQVRGTPVIGAKVGGVPELIEDGVTGTLFECANVEQLAQAIRELWEDPQRLEKYKKGCQELERDDTAQYCEKLTAMYR